MIMFLSIIYHCALPHGVRDSEGSVAHTHTHTSHFNLSLVDQTSLNIQTILLTKPGPLNSKLQRFSLLPLTSDYATSLHHTGTLTYKLLSS